MPGLDVLERHAASLRGRMGILVADERGGEALARDADEAFPAASVIKLPLVMALYAEAAAGRVDLAETRAPAPPVDGSGVLARLRDVAALSLRDLATLAIIVSDNTATNVLIDRLGPDLVNRRLDEWGCPRTRLRRKMYDHAARERGMENVMTPRETARLLAMLVRGALVDRATSDAVLEILHHNQDGTRLRRYLREDVWVANKSGYVERVRNDAGIVRAASAVVAVGFTRELVAEPDGDVALGLLGWCAWRRAGGKGPELPPGFEASA